jgi:hypothetical protein
VIFLGQRFDDRAVEEAFSYAWSGSDAGIFATNGPAASASVTVTVSKGSACSPSAARVRRRPSCDLDIVRLLETADCPARSGSHGPVNHARRESGAIEVATWIARRVASGLRAR